MKIEKSYTNFFYKILLFFGTSLQILSLLNIIKNFHSLSSFLQRQKTSYFASFLALKPSEMNYFIKNILDDQLGVFLQQDAQFQPVTFFLPSFYSSILFLSSISMNYFQSNLIPKINIKPIQHRKTNYKNLKTPRNSPDKSFSQCPCLLECPHHCQEKQSQFQLFKKENKQNLSSLTLVHLSLLHKHLQQVTLFKTNMCSCLCEGVGCCVCACCTNTCQSCTKGLGRERTTKICYLFLVIVFTVPAIAILFFINKWNGFKDHFSWMSCPSSSGGGQLECIGSSTIFRISISFLCLFGLLFVFMLFRARISMCLNEGFFCIKYLVVLGIFIALLFAPNQSFMDYAEASKYISIAFMIIQSIILIDLFYLAGIKLVARYDAGESSCGAALIFLTLFFEGIAVLLNVMGYVYFSKADGCGNSLWVNIITTIIIIVLPFLQLLNFNKQNSLLTTSLVSMYITYLAFVAQFSYGGSSCQDRMTVGSIAFDIIVSTGIFILTMYGTIMGGSGQIKFSENGDVNKAMGVAPTSAQDGEPEKKYEEKKQQSGEKLEDPESDAVALEKYTQSCVWAKWHLYMCIASIYIGMLVTNWTSANPTTGNLTSNDFGFWVRVAMSWVTMLIYIWTLIAPKVFPDRDFTVV